MYVWLWPLRSSISKASPDFRFPLNPNKFPAGAYFLQARDQAGAFLAQSVEFFVSS